MTLFDKAKFQLSESVLQITMIFNGVMSNQNQNSCLNKLTNNLRIKNCRNICKKRFVGKASSFHKR